MFDLDEATKTANDVMPFFQESDKSLDYVNQAINDLSLEQSKVYDDFVYSELSKLGYTLDYVQNQRRSKVIRKVNDYKGDGFMEIHDYFINEQCVLSFEYITTISLNGSTYTHQSSFKVIGGVPKDEITS